MIPRPRWQALKVTLTGHIARRKVPSGTRAHVVWDATLAGFGMQVRASGRNSWIAQYRQRGKLKKVTLGRCIDISAAEARARARALLAAAALDGLPKRKRSDPAPLFKVYADEFYNHCAAQWKPATRKANRAMIDRELIPAFGEMAVHDIRKADILRWRDSCAGRQGSFNRAIPVLSAMLQHAARLGHCRAGSNASKGIPRYRRQKLERYLTPMEYRRLGEALAAAHATNPGPVAILRLMIFTGARMSEIAGLSWDEVQPPRLALRDSKTGPKLIYLNRQAEEVLASVERRNDCPLVFPSRRSSKPLNPNPAWLRIRRKALIPDVRLHDLRHSFASAAIMDGVPLATIGKLLGHALHETTARYAHVADGAVADAAQRVSGSIAAHLGLRP